MTLSPSACTNACESEWLRFLTLHSTAHLLWLHIRRFRLVPLQGSGTSYELSTCLDRPIKSNCTGTKNADTLLHFTICMHKVVWEIDHKYDYGSRYPSPSWASTLRSNIVSTVGPYACFYGIFDPAPNTFDVACGRFLGVIQDIFAYFPSSCSSP